MKSFFSILLAILILASCQNASESIAETENRYSDIQTTVDESSSSGGNSDKSDVDGLTSAVAIEGSVSKEVSKEEPKDNQSLQKLIKKGYITVEVKDYTDYRKKLQVLVEKNGGYIGDESETNETYRISNEITLRIPSKAFDRVMSGLEKNGIKSDNKRVEVQDVGEEYADLEARILAKKAVEQRYFEILKKANKIEDILAVEEKLRVIREETEAAQGRIKYLNSQVSFSTIHLSFYTVIDSHYTPPSGPGFLSRIWEGLVRGWEGILEFIIGLAYLWPLWTIIALVIFFIRKRRSKNKQWPFSKKNP